jgi:hypothetical protein
MVRLPSHKRAKCVVTRSDAYIFRVDLSEGSFYDTLLGEARLASHIRSHQRG